MVFLGRLGFAGEIQKLRAIQADALGAAVQGVVDIVGEFDIGLEADDVAVDGLGGQVGERLQLAFPS